MNEPLQTYKGKPTVYLDQNILDALLKHDTKEFQSRLIDQYQIVYSDETLKEIQRSVGYEEPFLRLLNQLDARHLKIELNTTTFMPTGRATITERDVHVAFSEFNDNSNSFDFLLDAMSQTSHKFSGGLQGTSLVKIHEYQIHAFRKLMEEIRQNFSDMFAISAEELGDVGEAHKRRFEKTLADFSTAIKEQVPSTLEFDPIRDFRASYQLGACELNNLNPPNIVNQIWEKLAPQLPADLQHLEIEDFLMLKTNPIYPDQSLYPYQKVTALYNWLNTAGYYPDEKLKKKRGFVRSSSDMAHASIGSFADFLLSNDERFIKKINAAYEYLGIHTQTLKLKFSDPS